MIGVEPDASQSQTVKLDLATVLPPRMTNANTTITFQNVNERISQTSACAINAPGVADEDRRLVLHAKVPPNKRILVSVNSHAWGNFLASGDGIILYDAKVIGDHGKLYGLKALGALYTRAFESQKDEILRGPNGRYIITPRGFNAHAAETAKILELKHKPQGCCGGATIVIVRVSVAPTGEIVSVVPGSGVPAERASAVVGAVKGLRLKPFEWSGVAVPAEGSLPLLMDASGQLLYFR